MDLPRKCKNIWSLCFIFCIYTIWT